MSGALLTLALPFFFPLFETGAGEFVGLSVVNSSGRATGITATVLGSGGPTSGRVSIGAGRQHAVLLRELAHTDTWYLRITSNLPLHVAASIGARDGQSLAELPARQ